MPNFQAKISLGDRFETVSLTAPSLEEASRLLRKRGRVISITRESWLDLKIGLTPAERYIFFVKLAVMVSSKVPLSKALGLISETFRGSIRRVAKALEQKINFGMGLAEALETEPKSFPPGTIALIRAGISAGDTGQALREAADFEQMMQDIRKGSVKEIWTGIGYFIAAAGLTAGTMYYFGPMVINDPMFDRPGIETAWIEQIGWITLYVNFGLLGLLGILGFMGTLGRQAAPAAIDRLIAKIPFYSDLVLAKTNYLIFYKLSLMVNAGIRIYDALEITAKDAPRGALRSDLQKALKMIRNGSHWAHGMESLEATDRASLLSSSDRKDVARTFRILAEQFRDLYIARMKTLAPSLNLLAALFMTIASGVLFGLTILPMLQLASVIG